MTGADGVLVIAFGGPESSEEVRPFLRRVLAGRPISEERFEEVAGHYDLIGGRSPLPELTRKQVAALQHALSVEGEPLPCRLGMRNSAPFIEQTLSDFAEAGAKQLVGLILAAHESPASHGRYREAVEQARERLGDGAPEIRYTSSFHLHAGFIEAHRDHIQTALSTLPASAAADVTLIFTAHSIPTPAATDSPYAEQIAQSADAVTAACGRSDRVIAYQSRSGRPSDPWLEPDINDSLRELAGRGVKSAVLSPIGFVCDHVEVLFDLDVEAAATAREVGIELVRAKAPNDHPGFIRALSQVVLQA